MEKKNKKHMNSFRRNISPFQVKQRDRQSIELKFRYLLKRKPRHAKYTYDVNIYFFLPYSFNISPGSYDRNLFYNEMKLYLRFNTPILSAEELLNSESAISPLIRLEKMVSHFEDVGFFSNPEDVIYEGKLLACIYKSLLRDGLLEFSNESGLAELVPKRKAGYSVSFKAISEVARRYHRLVGVVLKKHQEIAGDILEQIKMIDEHLSLLTEKYLTALLVNLDKPETINEYTRMAEIVAKEIKYCQKSGYPTVMQGNTDNRIFEEHIYREKALKRYVSGVLFFDIRRKDTAKGVEQVLYAVAAGIAMVFATTAIFLGQSVFGRLSTSLFLIMVVSYMVKDRIKDFFRDALRRSLGAYFFDRSTSLYDAGYKKKLATIKERTFFLQEKKTNPDVLKLRDKGNFERILTQSAGETIFTYNKRINLNSKTLRGIHDRVSGLADINIINLGGFLRHLTVQKGTVPSMSEKGEISLHTVNRIYHLNMIIQIRKKEKDILGRYRLLVDAKGIKSIEHIETK